MKAKRDCYHYDYNDCHISREQDKSRPPQYHRHKEMEPTPHPRSSNSIPRSTWGVARSGGGVVGAAIFEAAARVSVAPPESPDAKRGSVFRIVRMVVLVPVLLRLFLLLLQLHHRAMCVWMRAQGWRPVSIDLMLPTGGFEPPNRTHKSAFSCAGATRSS
jgi:hypothetical protein